MNTIEEVLHKLRKAGIDVWIAGPQTESSIIALENAIGSLIALEFVPRGAVVWRFQPGFDVLIPQAGLERLSTVDPTRAGAYSEGGVTLSLSLDVDRGE